MIRVTLPAYAALMFASMDTFADDLTGQASILDGDTLEIHGTRIHLWGIDAPEPEPHFSLIARTPSAPMRRLNVDASPV